MEANTEVTMQPGRWKKRSEQAKGEVRLGSVCGGQKWHQPPHLSAFPKISS
jgi:hypothetical protein